MLSDLLTVSGAEFALAALVLGYFLAMSSMIWTIRQLRKRRRKATGADRPVTSLRRRLHLWLFVTTHVGVYLDLAQSFLSLVSCSIYVWETYQRPAPGDEVRFNELEALEIGLGSFFLLDYALRFYLAKDRLVYLYSFFGIIDVLTVMPMFLYFLVRPANMADVPMYFRLIRLMKLLRVLRSLRILRTSLGGGLRRRVYRLVCSGCALIFVAAGIFQFIEARGPQPVDFHVALYYSTIETLGRPRLECGTSGGFVWLIALVALSVVLIPKQIAELVSVMRSESVYARRRYHERRLRHIVVTGHQDFGSINCLLYEFYHPDRGQYSVDVVLLFEDLPSKEVEALVEHPAYVSHVKFLQGSPLVENDLERANVSKACAFVVLANKDPPDSVWEDCRITSYVLACKAHWSRDAATDHGKERRLFAQVLRAETREQLLRTPGWRSDDVVLVIAELTMIMVGLSAICRGLTTLILNLLTHVEEQRGAPDWYRQYEHGAMQEIYRVAVNESLAGASLADAAVYLLLERQVVLVAAEVSEGEDGRPNLVLYPGGDDTVLSKGDLVYCITYNLMALMKKVWDNVDVVGTMAESQLLDILENKKQSSKRRRSLRASGMKLPLKWWAQQQLGSASEGTPAWPTGFWDSIGCEGMEIPRFSEAEHAESHAVSPELGARELGPDGAELPEVSVERGPAEAVPQGSCGKLHAVRMQQPGTMERRASTSDATGLAMVPAAASSLPAGRREILQWLLHDGFGGDVDAMRAELAALSQSSVFQEPPLSAVAPAPGAFGSSRGVLHSALPALSGHIIVLGLYDMSGLRDLAKILLVRSEHAVVVLSPEATRIAQAAQNEPALASSISLLSSTQRAGLQPDSLQGRRILLLEGSPSCPRDWDSVQPHRASAAIFLPCRPPHILPSQTTERQHRIIDSATVALTNLASQESPGLWTVTQLLHGAAVKFFADRSKWTSASEDPRWLDITPLNTHALFAAGQIMASTMLDRLLIEAYFNDKAIPMIGLLIFGDERGSRLFQLPLPPEFAGKDYGKLCRYLLHPSRRLLPVGLLRESGRSYAQLFRAANSAGAGGPEVGDAPSQAQRNRSCFSDASRLHNAGEASSSFADVGQGAASTLDTSTEAQLPFVVTNPGPGLLLEDDDIVFVIGHRPEGLREVQIRQSSKRSPPNVTKPKSLDSSILSRLLSLPVRTTSSRASDRGRSRG